MSANIPSTMPMSDLLKSTGYNCPEELQGKTFDEATSGGDTKISTNTAATVDVSTYTEPVEIEPAEGYDATKKVTLTLENIPSGADLEANHAATIDVSQYTEPVEIEPTVGKDGMEKATVTLTNIPSGGSATAYAWILTSSASTGSDIEYLNIANAPTNPAVGDIKWLSIDDDYLIEVMNTLSGNETYTKVSDTEFTVSYGDGGQTVTATYTRDATKDFTLWQE